MNNFTNREIAIAIWVFLIFILILFKREIRIQLFNLLKLFFKTKIVTSIVLMITYTAGIIFLLKMVNFWNISLLKDTVYWFCFAGAVTSFNFVISKEDQNLFRKIIIDNVKIVIIIEFIVNTYTFSLGVELFLIPFLILITIITEVSTKKDDEYSSVAKLMQGLQTIIGVIILIFAMSNVISDYKSLGSLDTLKSFLLPFILYILFFPFIYFFSLFVNYGQLFSRLDLGCEKSKKLKRHAKIKIIQHCLFSLKKVKKALDMNIYNLMAIRNEEDVEEMIKVYKNQV